MIQTLSIDIKRTIKKNNFSTQEKIFTKTFKFLIAKLKDISYQHFTLKNKSVCLQKLIVNVVFTLVNQSRQ